MALVAWFRVPGDPTSGIAGLQRRCDARRGSQEQAAAKLEDCLTYIDNNQSFIVNCGDRFRHCNPIASGFVESAVNQVVAKRFGKQQRCR